VKCEKLGVSTEFYKTKQNKSREVQPETTKSKIAEPKQQSQAKQERRTPTKQSNRKPQKKPSQPNAITSKAQAWTPPTIAPPSRR
jgi:hypothetical protein